MVKHYLLLLALYIASCTIAFSQDKDLSTEEYSIIPTMNNKAPQGIYHEPRWVSWPSSAISFNLLGLAQVGPTVQVDIRLVKNLYLVPSARYNYLGYASHILMTNYDSDSMKYSPASYGIGLGIRQFYALQKKNNLVLVGLFGEYSSDKASYNLDEHAWESERLRQAANVMANLGYRWWFRKNFMLQVGAYFGISFELKDESRYLNGAYEGTLEKDFKNNPFIGLIDFSFGWNL